jgi:hypothetical protein
MGIPDPRASIVPGEEMEAFLLEPLKTARRVRSRDHGFVGHASVAMQRHMFVGSSHCKSQIERPE